jgi:hypothetical protein
MKERCGRRKRKALLREKKEKNNSCELRYAQEHGVFSYGYEVKVLVEMSLVQRLIQVSDGLQSQNVLLVPEALEWKISRNFFHREI